MAPLVRLACDCPRVECRLDVIFRKTCELYLAELDIFYSDFWACALTFRNLCMLRELVWWGVISRLRFGVGYLTLDWTARRFLKEDCTERADLTLFVSLIQATDFI